MSETKKIPVGRQIEMLVCPNCKNKFHVDDMSALTPDVAKVRWCPFCGWKAEPGKLLSLVQVETRYAFLSVETLSCSNCNQRTSVQLHETPGGSGQPIVFIPPEQLPGCPWCQANW